MYLRNVIKYIVEPTSEKRRFFVKRINQLVHKDIFLKLKKV